MGKRTNLEIIASQEFDCLREDLLFAWNTRKRRDNGSDYLVEHFVSELTDLCTAFNGLSEQDLEFLGDQVAKEYEEIASWLLECGEILASMDLTTLFQLIGSTIFIDMEWGAMDSGVERYSPGLAKLMMQDTIDSERVDEILAKFDVGAQ